MDQGLGSDDARLLRRAATPLACTSSSSARFQVAKRRRRARAPAWPRPSSIWQAGIAGGEYTLRLHPRRQDRRAADRRRQLRASSPEDEAGFVRKAYGPGDGSAPPSRSSAPRVSHCATRPSTPWSGSTAGTCPRQLHHRRAGRSGGALQPAGRDGTGRRPPDRARRREAA